jgi:glycosyltransferase involved in cell wall biosynthesis
MKISLVITVKNEARSLPALLDSIAAQTRPPDEVIICDGGSSDHTLEILRHEPRLPLRVIERPGSNISQGRNAAMAKAAGDIIASTDAGVRLDPRWLEKIVEPIESGGAAAVAGFFLPDVHTPFEMAMGATVLPQRQDVKLGAFLPSSRSVAYRRDAWQAVGGYPEWLDYCEDLLFDFRLRERYGPFAFAPEAIVHFKPRPALRSFFKQYYLYARGDGKADLWLKRHLIRYATYLVALPGVAILIAGVNRRFGLLYVLGAAFYLRRPYQRLIEMMRARDLDAVGRFKALGWVPVIRVVGDLAKMIGYPVGVWWRLKHRLSRSRHNQQV